YLLSPAAPGRDSPHVPRTLVDRALVESVRLRGHAGVGGPRFRILDDGGPAGSRRLEDRRWLRRRFVPTRLLRALRARAVGRGGEERRRLRGQLARAAGHRAPLGRRAPGGRA